MRRLVFVLLAGVLVAASCAGWQPNKGTTGALGGAAVGALAGQAIGKSTEATLLGAAVGGMVGYVVGNEMDKYDRQQLNRAYEQAPSGQAVAWVNPDSGNRYQVVPQPAYTSPGTNQVCRQAEVTAMIEGRQEQVLTTACRDPYGQWRIQNQ